MRTDYGDLESHNDEAIRLIRVFAACRNDRCEQGKLPCPTPQHCLREGLSSRYDEEGGSLLLWFVCLVGAGALMALFAGPIIDCIRWALS